MLARQGLEQRADIVRFGPHATDDEMAWRTIERNAPGTQVVVVDFIVGNVVDLRMLGDKFIVERINGRMSLYARRITFTKGPIHRTSLCVR